MHVASLISDQNKSSLVIGVDVGGTKIAASLVNDEGKIINPARCPTVISSPDATLDSISNLVLQLITANDIDRGQITGVGLGIPGLIDAQNGVGIASVNLNWQNVPVKEGLEKRLSLPCFIENDVKAAALGEMRYGAGKGLKNLALLTIGTGVAAAFISDGKIIRGAHTMAGEIGHFMIDPHGPRCKCGGRGCLEALVSGPAIVARTIQKMGLYQSSLLVDRYKKSQLLTSEDVFYAARENDPCALEIINEICQYVAMAVQFIILSYDPQVVVLSGGVPQAGKIFFDPLNQALQKLAEENWVFNAIYKPGYVQPSTLGCDAGILGAAALVHCK